MCKSICTFYFIYTYIFILLYTWILKEFFPFWANSTYIKRYRLSNKNPNTQVMRRFFFWIVGQGCSRDFQTWQAISVTLGCLGKVSAYYWRCCAVWTWNLEGPSWIWPEWGLFMVPECVRQASKEGEQLSISSYDAYDWQQWPAW